MAQAQLSQFGQLLAKAQAGANREVQKQAEQTLLNGINNNLPQIAVLLCQELKNPQNPTAIRQMAGIQLKNAISGRSEQFEEQAKQRWMKIPHQQQENVKKAVLECLSASDQKARNAAAMVVGKLAKHEIPENRWGNLIQMLVHNIKNANAGMKEACLNALGYTCEEMQGTEYLASQGGHILDAIKTGIEQQVDLVKLAAVKAMINSLDFVKQNFENQQHSDLIMKMIMGATQHNSQDGKISMQIRMFAMICLCQIMTKYYDKMARYIQNLHGITIKAIEKDHEDVAKQAIEFWSSTCEEELDIKWESQQGQPASRRLQNVVQTALPTLLPKLFGSLLKQSDSIEDDSWTVAKAGGACVELVSEVVEGSVIQITGQFIQKNITSQNWRAREAAVVAFGIIMNGPKPEQLASLVNQALQMVLKLINDPNDQVKESASWTLGRICQYVPAVMKANQQALQATVQAFGNGLKLHPKVAGNICWGITMLANEISTPDMPTTPLSGVTQQLIAALLARSQASDADEHNLISNCYEAINDLITCAGQDVHAKGVIKNFAQSLMQQLGKLFTGSSAFNQDQRMQTTQTAAIASMNSVVGAMMAANDAQSIRQMCQPLMQIMMVALKCNNASIHEEVFMIIGVLAQVVGDQFANFVPAIKPFLLQGLQAANESPSLCRICVGTIGDIARTVGQKMQQFSDEFVQALLTILRSQEICLEVKPSVIDCLSDLALALGGAYERYLPHTMKLVIQAGMVEVPNADEDMVETLGELFSAVLQVCSAQTQSMQGTPKFGDFLQAYAQPMVNLITKLGKDRHCLENGQILLYACTLMRDLIQLSAPNPQARGAMLNLLKNQDILRLLNAAQVNQNSLQDAQWVRKQFG